MYSPKSSTSHHTERGCFRNSQVLPWTVAGASILFLSVCFVTRCVVTYRSSQIDEQKKLLAHETVKELSCYGATSGIPFKTKPKRKEFYIGLTDQVVEGQWQWVDDTPFTESLSFWDAGEPNNIVYMEDCVTIRDSGNPRKNWNDIPCFYSMPWICEMPEINPLD